jgi:hypothetical protein
MTIEAQTVRFWTQRTGHECAHEEARQMVENVAGFFAVLATWGRQSREELQQRQECSDEHTEQSPRRKRGS